MKDRKHALVLKLRAQYDQEVAEHVVQTKAVIDAGRAIFRVGKPGSPFYAAEIALLGFGKVYVNGDVDLVVFGNCGDRTWQEKLTWLSGNNYGYAEEKASIGSTCSDMARGYDPDCAKGDVLSWRRRKIIDKATAREAVELIEAGDYLDAQRLIYENSNDSDVGDIGKCTQPRVIMAQALITKLCALLGLS